MKKYICKPRVSVMTERGIVGCPKDPTNPKKEEILTAKDFKNGQETITALLARVDCPIIKFKEEELEVPENADLPNAAGPENTEIHEKPEAPKAEQPKIKGAERK